MPFSIMIKTILEYCPLVAGDNKLVESLKQRQFDVAIEDVNYVKVCMSVIPYKLSIPFHSGRTWFNSHNMRTLVHPLSYPASFAIPLTYRMTYTDRIFNAMMYFILLVAPELLLLNYHVLQTSS